MNSATVGVYARRAARPVRGSIRIDWLGYGPWLLVVLGTTLTLLQLTHIVHWPWWAVTGPLALGALMIALIAASPAIIAFLDR